MRTKKTVELSTQRQLRVGEMIKQPELFCERGQDT